MKVTRTTGAVMLAAGALTVLGFAGTALANADDSRPRTAASPSPSADDTFTPGTDDTFGPDDSSSASPENSFSDDSFSNDSFSDDSFSDDSSPDGSFSASPEDSSSPSPSHSSSSSSSPDDSVTASPSSSATSAAPIRITAGQAKTIALRAAGGGRIESIERETEHGRLVWDVDVIRNGIEHDIDVDAATGKVTRHRTDDDRAHSTRSNDDTRGHGSDDSRGRGGDDHRGHGSDDKHDDDSRGRGHGSDD